MKESTRDPGVDLSPYGSEPGGQRLGVGRGSGQESAWRCLAAPPAVGPGERGSGYSNISLRELN